MKRKEFFKIIFLMFLPFSNILGKNIRKRYNIKSKIDKSSPKPIPKDNKDYYLYL